MKRVQQKILAIFVLLSLTAAALGQTAGPVFPDPGKTSMSKEKQQALGMEVTAQVYQQMPVLPDNSPETQYVRQIGKKLVGTIPSEYGWPFEFHVIPQKEINAFAIPGGQMFINIGTITAATKEAELAGVMAHEIAHVYMQHSAKQAGKAQKTSILAGIASAVAGSAGGIIGDLSQMGIQMGAQGMMAKYSRGDESQADAVGAVILYKAGYDPQGMVDFFKTMQGQTGKVSASLFSSHPNPGNRQEAIAKQIANWPKANYTEASPAFDKVKQGAMQVKAYSAQEIEAGAKSGQWAAQNQTNGAGPNSSGGSGGVFPTAGETPAAAAAALFVPLERVLPGRKMVNANLGPMSISHPDNWQVTPPKQQGQFVTIAPQAGVTEGGVGYGVLLNGIPAGQNQRQSIDELTAQLIKQIQQSNKLEQLGAPKPVTVGSMEGRYTLLRSDSPFQNANNEPQTERDLLITVVPPDGSLIYMIFVAPEADFSRFQPTYEAMLKSVRFN